jgi:hypothetical protein
MSYQNNEERSLNQDTIEEIELLYIELKNKIKLVAKETPEKLSINLIEQFYSEFSHKRDNLLRKLIIKRIKGNVNLA